MKFISIILFTVSLYVYHLKNVSPTIDMNAAQLQYLTDHLTLEECRTLVAGAILDNYEKPNVLDQAGKSRILSFKYVVSTKSFLFSLKNTD